ncbi:MAG: hypothetical protein AAFV98_18775 [Chloroflexota bacterium]
MSLALFTVKFLHSLVVIVMFACLYVVWLYALHGLYRRWVGWAIGAIMLEIAVYVGWGWRCPLTDLAIVLGDDTGADFIAELLLLENVDVVSSFGVFFAGGLTLSGRRYWHEKVSH